MARAFAARLHLGATPARARRVSSGGGTRTDPAGGLVAGQVSGLSRRGRRLWKQAVFDGKGQAENHTLGNQTLCRPQVVPSGQVRSDLCNISGTEGLNANIRGRF